MAREDVYVPRFEPAAVDYNPDNIDRNFNEVRDTVERLRDSVNSQSDETVSDLAALEGTVTTISESVYEPTTGLAATRARLITEEGVRASADSALAARATTLEATVNDGTTGLVATRARLITEESTRASADSALASRATALETTVNDGTTGLVATRARLITEESTRASADSALSSSITTLTAQTNGNPNIFPYPTPINNRTPSQLGWAGDTISSTFGSAVGGLVYFKSRSTGGAATTEYYVFDLPETMFFSTGQQITLSAYGYGGAAVTGDRLYMYLDFRSADNSTSLYTSTGTVLNSASTRQATTGTFPGASTTGRLRVVFARDWPASGSYQDVVFNMVKVEQGPSATVFTNSAQVIVQGNAISTLNDSAAFYQILVAASGGDPAIIRLFSGLGGSEVAIAARVLSLINTSSGANMEVMRAVGGEAFFRRPISSDSGGRRVTIGPGFGVSGSEIVLWFGPDTIAPSAQSRTNGYFALGTDGKIYYGTTELATAGGKIARSTTASGVLSGTYSPVISASLVSAPAGLAEVQCLYTPSTWTGSSTNFQVRLTRAGVMVAESPVFLGIDGAGVITPDWLDNVTALQSYYSAVSGNATWAIEAKRTSGAGSVTAATGELVINQQPT